MAHIHYIGPHTDDRQVFGKSFNIHNGWSLPEDLFTEEQLLELERDPGFLLDQPVGPRTAAPPAGGGTIESRSYEYYRAILALYGAVAMTNRVVIGDVQPTVEPGTPPVFWIKTFGDGRVAQAIVTGD